MHGRLRVKTSAQKERERLELDTKKAAEISALTSVILTKRQKCVYDTTVAREICNLLASNPDFATAWNYRREILNHWLHNEDKDYCVSIFDSELTFTQQCLLVNPKSYYVWHHRIWVVDHHPNSSWQKEISLCDKYLKLDSRNFHCWDYRRIAVARTSITLEEELNFSNQLICENFSNYSSWHYRCCLIKQMAAANSLFLNFDSDIIVNELELIHNAVYTDPADQSAWFYYFNNFIGFSASIPLFGNTAAYVRNCSCMVYLGTETTDVCLFVRCSQPVSAAQLAVTCSCCTPVCDLTRCDWISASNSGYIWKIHVSTTTSSSSCHSSLVLLRCGTRTVTLDLCQVPTCARDVTAPDLSRSVTCVCANHVTDDYSATCLYDWSLLSRAVECEQLDGGGNAGVACEDTRPLLNGWAEIWAELKLLTQLDQLEPHHKWVMLSLVYLLRKFCSTNSIYEKAVSYIRELQSIDPMRYGYYQHLSEQLTVEYRCRMDLASVQLKHMSLTHIPFALEVHLVVRLDISDNLMAGCLDLSGFVHLQYVDCSHNKLETIRMKPTTDLHTPLRVLIAQHNSLREFDSIIGSAVGMETVDLNGNVVCNLPGFDEWFSHKFHCIC